MGINWRQFGIVRILSSISRRVFNPEALFSASIGTSIFEVNAWPWNTSTVGFGAKYANPTSGTNDTPVSIDVRPGNTTVAVGVQGSPYLSLWPWSFYGFGTRYTSVNIGGRPIGLGFSSTGNTISFALNASPHISAYPFTTASGLGTKYANPSTAAGQTQNSIGWRTSGAVASTQDTSPYVKIWSFTEGVGWGSKYGDITSPSAALITGAGYDAKFSPSGSYLAVAHLNSPFLHTYNWSVSTGFTAYWFDPTTLPDDGTTSVSWHPTSNNMVFTVQATSGIAAYEGVEDYGTKFANPTGVNSYYLSGSFSKNGTAFSAGYQSTASTWGIDTWDFTADVGFGTKYSSLPGPYTSISSNVLGLQFTK